jgi:predicted dehydrogenase
MSVQSIGVGIIGVEPGHSWSAVAHIPALKSLPQYKLVALSTRHQESADAAARFYGIEHAFDNHQALVSHPDVDFVVVAVKVPHHLELVTAAIEAGKAVYCEWPLGIGLQQAVQMADLARQQHVHATVGLQARAAPVVRYVRDLIAADYVGEVLSSTLVGTGFGWGESMARANADALDRRNGVTLLTVPFGHAVDALCYTLGEIREVTALTAQRRSQVRLVGSEEIVPLNAEDQLVVAARLETGALASVHYRGGTRGTGLLWEINGTKADLRITANGGNVQMVDLSLFKASAADSEFRRLEVPPKYFWAPREVLGPAFNIAQTYVRLAEDVRNGTRDCPDFADAAARHELIEAVERAATTGRRVTLSNDRVNKQRG